MQRQLNECSHLINKKERLDVLVKEEMQKMAKQTAKSNQANITIPVVFHVLYNNSEENISDTQLHSQIEVLNEDYRRQNSDTTNTWTEAADTQIEFCLADIDLDGNFFEGITRKLTNKTAFDPNGFDMFTSSTGGKEIWLDYLNIYVCNLDFFNFGILGVAPLPGYFLTYDGVVLDYRTVGRGSSNLIQNYNLGRTATHKIGHWLNLNDIWGFEEGNCETDDGIDDTPNSMQPYLGCATGSSCGSLDMSENFMDYHYDQCMNLFTQGQANRMTASINIYRPYLLNHTKFNNETTNVYPGDLNHDGIVNHVDHGLIGLYKAEIGPSRTSVYRNIEWYPHPAKDWGTQQLNNEDIKHFDCNGDGFIDAKDWQAVVKNMDSVWTTPMSPPKSPQESDYQVMLQPIEQIYEGYFVMNIALERKTNGDINLQGGYFTIDYSNVDAEISQAGVNFEPSWLGIPNFNLWFEIEELLVDKKIEIGFTKNDNTNSFGSGVIGKLILEYDNNAARLSRNSNNMYSFEVYNIGVHNGIKLTPIENQVLQIDLSNNNCQTNWTITEDTPFQNQYKSDNLIETDGFLIIGNQQQVEYQANQILMTQGFSVKAGANFKVGHGNCD